MDPIVDNRNRSTATSPPGRPAVKPRPIDPFPRNREATVRAYLGKKVTVSTTDFHYVVGRLEALGADDALVLNVAGKTVRLPRAHLATIQEADDALAEYVK
jgi:hypothetical protein